MQTAGQKLDPTWSTFAEPVVDGRVTKTEYKNPTAMRVLNYASSGAQPGDIRFVSSAGSGALYLGIRAKGSTAAAGLENGTLTVYLDADHSATLKGQGCGTYGQFPAASDRKVSVTYKITSGPDAQVTSVKQEKGTCLAWTPLTAGETAWPVTVAASEPVTDPGFVHLEMKIVVPSLALSEGRLGLGLRRTNTTGATSIERLPYRDGPGSPDNRDVYSWETVHFTYARATQELTDAGFDGCCFPKPSQPGRDW
jgi:hypothetical protein